MISSIIASSAKIYKFIEPENGEKQIVCNYIKILL